MPSTVPIIIACLILAALAAAGAWDVYVIFGQPEWVTVSALLSEWSHTFPVLPMLVGLLLGHLFWPVRRGK